LISPAEEITVEAEVPLTIEVEEGLDDVPPPADGIIGAIRLNTFDMVIGDGRVSLPFHR